MAQKKTKPFTEKDNLKLEIEELNAMVRERDAMIHRLRKVALSPDGLIENVRIDVLDEEGNCTAKFTPSAENMVFDPDRLIRLINALESDVEYDSFSDLHVSFNIKHY